MKQSDIEHAILNMGIVQRNNGEREREEEREKESEHASPHTNTTQSIRG